MLPTLDDPALDAQLLRAKGLSYEGGLRGLVREASRQPWASALEVDVVEGQLRLRPTAAWGNLRECSAIVIGFDQFELLSLALVVGKQHDELESPQVLKCRPEAGVQQLEALLLELFARDPTGRLPSGLHDPLRPARRFAVGDPVSVLGTRQAGTVRKIRWHHRHCGWMYYLEADGVKISRRYWDADLEKR